MPRRRGGAPELVLFASLFAGGAPRVLCLLEHALEAVVRVPGSGDQRCTPLGVSADSGYLRVAGMDGSALVALDVRSTGTVEPAVPLRQAYVAFRALHPCGSLPSQMVTCSGAAGALWRAGSGDSPSAPSFGGVLASTGVAALVVFAFLGLGKSGASEKCQ